MNKEYVVGIGFGIRTTTYFKLMLLYPYGDDECDMYVHTAIFGLN